MIAALEDGQGLHRATLLELLLPPPSRDSQRTRTSELVVRPRTGFFGRTSFISIRGERARDNSLGESFAR